MVIFLILFIISFVMLIITSKKYNKLKNYRYLTDNEFIVNSLKEYDYLKNKALLSESVSLRNVLFDYFDRYDLIINNYFYPKLGVDTSEEKE